MNYQNLFNRDFYPTPRSVFDKMTEDESLVNAVVLEPSAGSGNLVKYCKEAGAKYIKACEINDTLRASLRNSCYVIGSDFFHVKREDVADVTHIVMNPPFSNYEKHVLHAWEIAPDGCVIISVIPTSGTSYPVGDEKKITELADLHGIITDLGDAFNTTEAERRTAAEVSVLRLYKPDENSSFLNVDLDETPEGMDDMGTGESGLIKYDVVRDLVKRYNAIMARFDAAQELNKKIDEDLKAFKSYKVHFGAVEKEENGDIDFNREITRDMFRKQLQMAAWHEIFKRVDMEKYTTSVLTEKIAKYVMSSNAKPFTYKNVYRVIINISQNINNLMRECVVNAFDEICKFSAENNTAGEKWKTNSNYMVNQKFIVPDMNVKEDELKNLFNKTKKRYLTVKTNDNKTLDIIDDVYKALCYVSGKEMPKGGCHPFLTNVIENCFSFGDWYYFDWFRVKFFKKGTMHFEFIDINVWYRFNQIAAEAKGWKIGSSTQCKKRKVWRDVEIPKEQA